VNDIDLETADLIITISHNDEALYAGSTSHRHWSFPTSHAAQSTEEIEGKLAEFRHLWDTLKSNLQALKQALHNDQISKSSSKTVQAEQAPTLFDEEIDRRGTFALKINPRVTGEIGNNMFIAGVADMDFNVPDVVTAALHKRLEHAIFGYEITPDSLLPTVTAWLSNRHGWQVDQNHILRTPSVLTALAITAALFTDEGDGIIVQPPAFLNFFDIIRRNHRTVISNPLILKEGQYRMDFDDLEQKASAPRTKMIYLCNPHNPIGRVWTAEELTKLGEICARHQVLVVSDEMHNDITLAGHNYTPFASLGDRCANNSITCISPAKTFNIASCASAFIVIKNEQRRAAFEIESSRLSVNKNNTFSNVAMEAAYQSGGPWLDELLSYVENNVTLVRHYLQDTPGVELINPEATFLVWLDFRKLCMTPKALSEFLKQEAKWSVIPGELFGAEGEGFARVNIGCTKAKLTQALEQLKSAILRLSQAASSESITRLSQENTQGESNIAVELQSHGLFAKPARIASRVAESKQVVEKTIQPNHSNT
jgi:cysteine-S-conjugate beta-lyase